MTPGPGQYIIEKELLHNKVGANKLNFNFKSKTERDALVEMLKYKYIPGPGTYEIDK